MLRQETIDIIKSTVPVLEVHGTAITKHFYQRMFKQHPELLNIFNHANQKQGRQQTALANAVLAAAQHIDRLGDILPAVLKIAHKHRSLGIKPEHYPIVGENLLASIKEVLGDAATDEILGAWAEAYGVIADAFIGVEANMYAETEQKTGGWKDFRKFRVDRKVKESDVITSFYFVPEDGGAIADFVPGQYISLKLEIPGDEYTHIRQYSLSDAPGQPYYRISVKREGGDANRPAGKVSVYLHDQVKEGDTLLISAPAGDFVLDREDPRPVVLISGGVGLTPMVSMLNTLAAEKPDRSITFVHAARNGQVHAMKEPVAKLAAANPNVKAYTCYSAPTEQDTAAHAYDKKGYIDAAWLKQILPTTDAVFYFCGPVPFMQCINAELKALGVPDADIRYEFFGPAAVLEAAAV
ncbi:NO-inducible flavohemoprotein [Cohnella lubricantis]|uniref:Flavohemoprotein n=2 Tax=Cohnella lubricantis TaxID=2163172 RepID=A0A841T8A6_9BACL|nr:NO-inducible flavohemoprotein [Cohnella lubricantis]MBB6676319.1 NO-inducible flavohemoprotein [Cohnella lubricantis]MBP2120312.1 nitric oxide dioxygenase [Cohnella lubricantis]